MKRRFVETGAFTEALDARKSRDLLGEIQTKILENPLRGDVMKGCGGVRKMRVSDPSRNKGTRGGLRVLYLDLEHIGVTYLIYAYGKDEGEDISPEARKQVAAMAKAMKQEYRNEEKEND